MIPGGIADKLGNRYEAKWLVRSFMDVVANKAHWLKFESVETEYQGFEFAIAREDIIEWHQTKINAPKGNWTINALKKEGVLKAFSKRLMADEKNHCYFISQDNANDFRILTDKAQLSNSYDEYMQVLSKEQLDYFQILKKEWQQSDEIIFAWLKRSHVEIIPQRELESLIESYGDLYFINGSKTAFPNLRDILENHFNKTLTCEAARTAIKQSGKLNFKEWLFNQTIRQHLIEETDAYLQTYTPFGTGGETIIRDQINNLIDEILIPDSPELVMIAGVAGSGKSGIIRGAIDLLRKKNIPHLAFRIDHYLSCSTKEELGKILTGREESPVSTLKGTFPDVQSILFIDQVDAISEVSGRDGQVKEVLFRLITDAHNFGGITVVVACRTFDLDSDPRLKKLKEANQTKTIDIPLFDWHADVEPLLKKKGIDVSSLTKSQSQLLLFPINLAIFMEIDDPKLSFYSRSNLYEKLIEKKQRTITKERKTSWPLIRPLKALCDWMSKRQRLNAPVSVLDDYQNAADILSSEGMIISSRGQVNFFHESFFDHVYARAFVNNNQNLLDLLTEIEQHLFRRTQVRQILEALRQNDFDRYITELSMVLESSDVRFHIKAAICQWLNSIDNPTEQEFEIIHKFNKPSGKFDQFFRKAVLSTSIWFDYLNGKNWIRQQIDGKDEVRSEEVLWWLRNIAGEKPSEVATILRYWWDSDTKRSEQLLDWFSLVRRGKPDNDLFLLCEDIIKSNPKNLFKNHKDSRITMLLHTWGEKSPENCGRLLNLIFEAWFVINPGRNPFDRKELEEIDIHSLTQIAKKMPQEFLQGTTDAFVRLIDMAVAEAQNGKNRYDFNYRTYSGHHFGFDEFLNIYRSALNKIAQDAPEVAIKYLEKLNPYKHQCFMHLHLESIRTNPKLFGKHLPELASNKIVFDSGWNGAEWLLFAYACREAMPHLASEEKNIVEQAILNYTPEIDLAVRFIRKINKNSQEKNHGAKESVIYYLNRSGYKQLCIIETIGENLLSPVVLSRLYKLHKKFPKAKIKEPSNTEVHLVGSPIKRDHCAKMKDSHWLSAIRCYDNDEFKRYGHDFIDGGAQQLANELQEATKKDPKRFCNLCLKIPDSAHHAYIEHILWGLADTENLPSEGLITQVIKCAHQHPDKPFGKDIARLIEKHPHIATDLSVTEILIWYALNGEANENENSDTEQTESQTISIETLMRQGQGICIRTNNTRGSAWEALGSILWQVKEAENFIWDAIEIALNKENLISVRCCMMKPLIPLFNMNKDRFSDSINRLIILPDGSPHKFDSLRLSPLVTHDGIHLFPYIFYWLPKIAEKLVAELLTSDDEKKELIGSWLIFCESFRNDEYIFIADELATKSMTHKRLLAQVACDAIAWADNRHRVETILKKFFFDDDSDVRKIAARVFGNAQPKDVALYKDLSTVFLKSPAFGDNSTPMLHMLEDATCDVLGLVLEATQQIITDIMEKGDKHGFSIDTYRLPDLLKREYVSSESNSDARKRILDLIDLMLYHEIYGADSITAVHDRL